MREKRIHIIANAHVDPVWLWDKYEGIDEVLNTFRSACDRLDEYPELYFSASSLQFYEWVLQYDPKLFARIKEKVVRGRWEITGGWWVEPDCNLPTGTSFYKHAGISREFTRKYFNKKVEVAFVPDSFGHSADLPEILKETGFKYFIFCRPSETEKPDLPANLFWWEYRGCRVLAYRLKYGYGSCGVPDRAEIIKKLDGSEYKSSPVNGYFFGVGDHGGGPTIAEIEFYRTLFKQKGYQNIGFSTCLNFFRQAEKIPGIPVYSGDLFYHAVGCYSVNRGLKDSIRRTEHGLEFAERSLRMAGMFKKGRLDSLWKKTLFNQFHDIMAGSSSPDACYQTICEMGGVEDTGRLIAYNALKKISTAKKVAVREGEFRIFNTLPFPARRPITLETWCYLKEGAPIKDTNGRKMKVQEVTPGVHCVNKRWEFIDTLPEGGFKSYYFDVHARIKKSQPPKYEEGTEISNRAFCVKAPGVISRFRSGENLLNNPLKFLVLDDGSDTWSHGVRSFDNVIGTFNLKRSAIMTGPVVSKLYQELVFGSSRTNLIFSLYQGIPGIYIEIKTNWAEKRKILKMEFCPAIGPFQGFTVEGPGGAIQRRADSAEDPLHHWMLMKGSAFDFGLIQDGAFAYDCKGSRLRITLVRSSLYGYHYPYRLNDLDPQNHTDQGEHIFRLRIFFQKDITPEFLSKEASLFLEPCLVIREGKKGSK